MEQCYLITVPPRRTGRQRSAALRVDGGGGAVNRLTGNPEPEADVGRARPRRQSAGGHFTSATDPSPVAFGGVVFLSHSQFVHSDTRRVRYWTGS